MKKSLSYGTVQVAAFWHMRKVALAEFAGVVQLALFAPDVSVQFPTTTPLLSVPVVVVVPFDVPVRLPVRANTLPPELLDVTTKFNVPVTWPAEFVLSVAVPLSDSWSAPSTKHGPALKNPKPVMLSGSFAIPVVSVTLNDVTKFS